MKSNYIRRNYLSKIAPEEPNWITVPIQRKIDHTGESIKTSIANFSFSQPFLKRETQLQNRRWTSPFLDQNLSLILKISSKNQSSPR